ncbi:MAG: hypothetical protein JJU13_19095 [Balneolaceae bacterium]|nr:hypothetical protein [Balneolaceae bacterium]
MKKFRRRLARHAKNYKGFKTDRKIIVIESDDWGAIRMPSLSVFSDLLKKGITTEHDPYSLNDCLASETDLSHLFELLSSFRDISGRYPVITANCVTANPDFDAIRESRYAEYFHEPVPETLKRYPEHAGSFALWKEGLEKQLFVPQFHGREHVNVENWLRELKQGNPKLETSFSHQCWIYDPKINEKINIQASLDTESVDSVEQHKEILKEGLKLFEQLFGYPSESYIANNFVYHNSLNQTLKECGVNYIQGMKYHMQPVLGNQKKEMIRRYTGQKNECEQYHLVRNCVFEPSQQPQNFDNVGECLKDISNAFFWKKPAIITAHRLNFIGFLRPENRDKNLAFFKELLTKILHTWPNTEFMTSPELGDLIAGSDES